MTAPAPVAVFLDDIRDSEAHLRDLVRTGDRIIHTRSVNQTIAMLSELGSKGNRPYILSLDNDLGEYTADGGEGFRVALWLAEQSFAHQLDLWADLLIIHSSNSVRVENMLDIAERYGPYRRMGGQYILHRQS